MCSQAPKKAAFAGSLLGLFLTHIALKLKGWVQRIPEKSACSSRICTSHPMPLRWAIRSLPLLSACTRREGVALSPSPLQTTVRGCLALPGCVHCAPSVP